MDRLNGWLLVLAVLALTACGSTAPGGNRSDAGQDGLDGPAAPATATTQIESAELLSPTPVPAVVSALLRPVKAPAGLPPLPFDLPGLKQPDAIEQSFKDGNLSWGASPNATDDGTTKVLDSTDGELAWAVYEVPLLAPTAEIVKLYVTCSNFVPSGGAHQGWMYGLANYDKNAWEATLTQNFNTARVITVTEPYRSPFNGNAYVFVATAEQNKITVNRVGFDLSIVGWNEVTFNVGTNLHAATAIDFTLTDNPAIAYVNSASGVPWFAVGDREADVLDPGAWQFTAMDQFPPGDAAWVDMIIDDDTGLPRASFMYTGMTPATNGRTQMVFAALFSSGPGDQWFPYALKRGDLTFEDGAEWTQIAKLTGTDNPQAYGFVTHVANDTFRLLEPDFDMQYREFFILDLENPSVFHVERTAGFGDFWMYPHLAYTQVLPEPPATQIWPFFAFAVNGGNNFADADITNLFPIWSDENTTEFGSINANTVENQLGSTFVKTVPDEMVLTYIDYDDAPLGVEAEVTTAGTQAGGWIGANQLAFAPDGTPGIVFTECDGDNVFVKYATLVDAAWVVETVSADPSTPHDLDDMLSIIPDLAYDSTGMPAICYRHLDGTGTSDEGSLRVALRGL